MAQTPSYEKVVILKSDSNMDVFTENNSSKFQSYIYPRNYDNFDAIFPMLMSVPIKKDSQAALGRNFKLNENGKLIFKNKEFKVPLGSFQLKYINIGTVFNTKRNLNFDCNLILENFLSIDENQTFTVDKSLDCLFYTWVLYQINDETQSVFNDMIILNVGSNRWCFVTLKKDLNDHFSWILQDEQQKQFSSENTFMNDGFYSIVISVSDSSFIPLKKTFSQNDLYYNTDTWKKAEIAQVLLWLNSPDDYGNLVFVTFSMTYASPLVIPTLLEKIETLQSIKWDDDNTQIYCYCDQIDYSRIANQNENIFQETLIKEKITRLNDYISIPMFQPINLLNKEITVLGFELSNALGDKNIAIDDSRPTIILCKLIKKYYNFSDGQKKTYITSFYTH